METTLNRNAGRAIITCKARISGGRALGRRTIWGRILSRPAGIAIATSAEDIEATIYSALGIDWTTLRRDSRFGRGFEYVPRAGDDLYGPVHELWG